MDTVKEGAVLTGGSSAGSSSDDDSMRRRWRLILCSAATEYSAGAILAMGAWQAELRDVLGLTTGQTMSIGAAIFFGTFFAFLGGRAFDALGPRRTVLLGGGMACLGYLTLFTAVRFSDRLSSRAKLTLATAGSVLAGYACGNLLDLSASMACSLSFPHERAAVVGYMKAVLATSAGLWALLWVNVFAVVSSLASYLACAAGTVLTLSCLTASGIVVLPEGEDYRRPFDHVCDDSGHSDRPFYSEFNDNPHPVRFH